MFLHGQKKRKKRNYLILSLNCSNEESGMIGNLHKICNVPSILLRCRITLSNDYKKTFIMERINRVFDMMYSNGIMMIIINQSNFRKLVCTKINVEIVVEKYLFESLRGQGIFHHLYQKFIRDRFSSFVARW